MPSPSPSPPLPAQRPKPSRTSSQVDSAQVQATTASIFSASQHDHHPDDLEDDDGDEDYPPIDPEDEPGSLLPPTNFQPLFTVITDPQTRETYHPNVYYVFSDDAENEREGNDVATVAALRALDQTAQKQQQQYHHPQADEEEQIEERFIILDLEPIGSSLSVKKVSSLSPSWAVTSTTLRSAPTFDHDTEENAASLMLQLEGIELDEPASNTFDKRHGVRIKKEDAERKAALLLQEARKRGGGGVVQGMEEIWEGLNEGLGVLEKVIGDDPPDSK
jgi:hypothetical protein